MPRPAPAGNVSRMTDLDPRIASIPDGWAGRAPSRKPLRILPAELFNRSYRPAPDSYLHVAPLRRPPLPLLIACGVIAAVCGLIVWGTLAQAGTTPSMQGPMPFIVAAGFGVLGLFFLLAFVNAITASFTRGSWANRQCVAFGTNGVAIRLQGFDFDVPWHEVTAVRATRRKSSGKAPALVPVLRIERGVEHWDLQPAVIDADPVLLYSALHYYWMHPEQRAALGTVATPQQLGGGPQG